MFTFEVLYFMGTTKISTLMNIIKLIEPKDGNISPKLKGIILNSMN